MSGFQADPAAIRALAGRFGAAADEVGATADPFESTARDVSDAFGWLGPSEEMYADYQRAAGEAADGLAGVGALLAEAMGMLEATADNYEGADQPPYGP